MGRCGRLSRSRTWSTQSSPPTTRILWLMRNQMVVIGKQRCGKCPDREGKLRLPALCSTSSRRERSCFVCARVVLHLVRQLGTTMRSSAGPAGRRQREVIRGMSFVIPSA
ncbi:hypothetical protein GW17_00061402 [Ensete ventricosum]|nr:hypothetical protein GW17_00061402 [Ensete ventricosum]RZR78851.1 hypothetical protein BHM03_00004400 [Ensete ventricosum]